MTQIIAKEIFLISKNKPPERWFFNARAGREREILKGVFGIPGVSPGGCLGRVCDLSSPTQWRIG